MLFYQFLAHEWVNMVTYRNWIHRSRMLMDLGVTGTASQTRRAGADAECRVREQHSLCFISCLWCCSIWLLWRSSCFPGVSSWLVRWNGRSRAVECADGCYCKWNCLGFIYQVCSWAHKRKALQLFVVRLEHCLLQKRRLRRDLVITQSREGGVTAVFVFALAGGCGDCSVPPQAALVPVLVCPSVWGQMLPPGCFTSSYKDGSCREWLGKGICQAKAKFFLFSTHKEGEASPPSLPVAAAWHLLSSHRTCQPPL